MKYYTSRPRGRTDKLVWPTYCKFGIGIFVVVVAEKYTSIFLFTFSCFEVADRLKSPCAAVCFYELKTCVCVCVRVCVSALFMSKKRKENVHINTNSAGEEEKEN